MLATCDAKKIPPNSQTAHHDMRHRAIIAPSTSQQEAHIQEGGPAPRRAAQRGRELARVADARGPATLPVRCRSGGSGQLRRQAQGGFKRQRGKCVGIALPRGKQPWRKEPGWPGRRNRDHPAAVVGRLKERRRQRDSDAVKAEEDNDRSAAAAAAAASTTKERGCGR